MKLKKLTLINFKQFLGTNEIIFNTNGKMTVIYGFNGFGKTRLHSSFYWTLYGQDRDNENVYNNEMLKRLFDDDEHVVSSKLEFSHNETDYFLYRSQTFVKKNNVLRTTENKFTLRYTDSRGNHALHKEPEKFINQIFPSELSPYFLFDGEGMTNELLHGKRVTNFSKNLKEAVNQLFGLGIYENAISDLGSDSKKLGVIGELNSRKENIISDYSSDTLRSIVDTYTSEIEHAKKEIEELESKRLEAEDEIKSLSEQIGKKPNPRDIEDRNKLIQRKIDSRKKSKENHFDRFGKKITYSYVKNLVSGTTYNLPELSQEYYVESSNQYISRNLIKEILDTNLCVCGENLNNKKEDYLKRMLQTLPPVSFKHNYTRLIDNSVRRVKESSQLINELESTDRELVEIEQELFDLKKEYDQNLEKLKDFESVGKLVSKREEIEVSLKSTNRKIKENEQKITEKKSQVDGAKLRLKKLLKNTENNNVIQKRIDFVKGLKSVLEAELENKKEMQKITLEKSIKDLMEKMLAAKRDLKLNEDFTMELRTLDKKETQLSAGQSAVISFSYIGGVLKALKSLDYDFISKEYPLILDAPLSHLDREHISRVFKYLPDFADQIIIFSKEEIDSEIANMNEKTYEIRSNDYKNHSSIHEYEGRNYFTDDKRRINHVN